MEEKEEEKAAGRIRIHVDINNCNQAGHASVQSKYCRCGDIVDVGVPAKVKQS